MPMNSSEFPLVWMSFVHEPGQDPQKDFEEFAANLHRGVPFVLLSDTPPGDDHEHSPEEKKRTMLWMKKHKAQLRSLVLALIMVEPSAAKRLGLKAFAGLFAKVWGYPLLFAASRELAIEMAQELLRKTNRQDR